MAWTADRFKAELKTVRAWRGNLGKADAYASRCLTDAKAILRAYTQWDETAAVNIAIAWHPSKSLAEGLRASTKYFSYPASPLDGTGIAYLFLEGSGGRLPKAPGLGWASSHQARARFMFLSAALVVFEEKLYEEAREAGDLASGWLALQWMTRFHGNALRVRDDTLQRRKAGGRNASTKQRVATSNRQRVQAAYRRLTPAQRGSGAVSLIARGTGLSAPTIRAHLISLGLRGAKK